jgi:glycosyltransferase involved in cell wall biosynthesis
LNVPTISILMPVYNGGQFLAPAINSILNQSLTDFEFIIINDGSNDNSDAIIRSYLSRDNRIRYVSRENTGLINTLNEGLAYCRGRYVARMDADDISLPERLRTQFEFMENNPSILVCGTSVRKIDEKDNEIGFLRKPEDFDMVRAYSVFRSPVMHPSSFFRYENKFSYDTEYLHAEDYELWTRLLIAGYEIANLPSVGLLYRESSGNISSLHADKMQETSRAIHSRYIEEMFATRLTPDKLRGFCNVVHRHIPLFNELSVTPKWEPILKDSLDGFIKSVSLILKNTKDKNIRKYIKRYALSHFLGYSAKLFRNSREIGKFDLASILSFGAARLLYGFW